MSTVLTDMVVVVLMGVCGSGKTTVGVMLAEQLGWPFRDADEFHSEANKQKMQSAVPLSDEDRLPWLISLHSYITSMYAIVFLGLVSTDPAQKKCGCIQHYILLLDMSTAASLLRPDFFLFRTFWVGSSMTAIFCVHNESAVLTCSALKRWYRDVLRHGSSTQTTAAQIGTYSSDYIPPTMSSSSKVFFVFLKGSQQVIEARLAGRKGHFMSPDLLTSQMAILEEPEEDENCFTVDINNDVSQIVTSIIDKLSHV